MNRFKRVLKDNLLMILISILLIFQNIFGKGTLIMTGVIAGVQILRIILCLMTQITEYIQYFGIVQQWAYIIILFFISEPNLMSVLALCNMQEFFFCSMNTEIIQLKKLPKIHYFGSELILIVILSVQDARQIHLALVAISLHMIILVYDFKDKKVKKSSDSYTQEIHDKIVIESAGHTVNHSRVRFHDKPSHQESPRHERDHKLEVLSIFPQGIGLFKIVDNRLELDYNNENMLKLLQIDGPDQILGKLFSLEEQQITEILHQQQSDSKNSMSSFSTFQQTPIPCNSFQNTLRNGKRCFTNLQQASQKFELLRQNSAMNSIENKIILRKIDSLYEESLLEQEIKFITYQLSKIEYQIQMKNISQLVQEHAVIFGYQKGADGKKKRALEIKVYNALINDSPFILILVRDITHRDYIQALQEYSKQKSKTLSFVSHEYRTPLNCIIEMLEHGMDEEQKHQSQTLIMDKEFRRCSKNNIPIRIAKQIKIALDNARYLLSLSDDLLDLAQIKVGKFKINKVKFNFNLLIESCVDLFQVIAEKRSIKLYINYDSKAPRSIYSDSSRLKQIIINLLGNAFKFTEEGSVTLKVCLNNQKLDIAVIDTGIGINEEDQAKLFQAFGKGNSEEHKKMNKSGVGLGLLISNQILQNLNQDVQSGLKFKSQYKKGSIFYFSINYQDVNEIQSLNSMQERNQDSEDSVTMQNQEECIHRVYVHPQISFFKRSTKAIMATQILIVDDVCMNIDMLKRQLNKLGWDQVDTVQNGYSAVDKCEKKWQINHEFYKLIFMDLEMPRINGIQTTKKILELSKQFGINVTIIGCSAHESSDQKQECIQAGMTDYLTKPIKQDELLRILQQYL